MKYFAINLVLAIFWMFLVGSFELFSLLVGFLAGLLVLTAAQAAMGSAEYIRTVGGVFRFVAVFLWKLVAANIQLASDIIRPKPRFQPGFIRFQPERLGPAETALLANMISLTPGTLTVDTDDDGRTLYIHTVYAQDTEAILESIRVFVRLIHGLWEREE